MVEPYESRRQKKPTGAVKPMTPVAQPQTRSYPMYPGSSGWDTAPGWLSRAGGVNTSTPAGQMFAAMNRPSVPAAIPAKPVGPSPWDIGTAAMNLDSPQLVKPYESSADRHAQAAAQQRRRPVGGQMAGELAASAGNFSTGPNLSIPGGAEAVARAEAKRQQAATLAQSFDRLRERSQAVPFGTYLAGTPETIGNLTEGRPWIDPAKTVTEQMTWPEYVMKNRAQMAAMQQGRPFDLTPAWIGPSGRQRPPSTWELAKNKESTREDGSTVADVVRERSTASRAKREEGLLPQGSRRAMVTAKAQGRRISPVQAGVEAAMAAGNPLSDDQKAMMFGPAFAEIQARNEASRMAALASILAPGEFPQSPVVSNWAMGQLQGMMPGGGALPPRPINPAEAATVAEQTGNARDFVKTLVNNGADQKEAEEEARRRFPTSYSPLRELAADAISYSVPGLRSAMDLILSLTTPPLAEGTGAKEQKKNETSKRGRSLGGIVNRMVSPTM